VIVGGGFAGIAAARALKRCDAEIVLIDQRNHHIFQPLLYQVATAVLAPSEIAAPMRQLAYKQKNVSVILAEVTDVDLNSRSVGASCAGVGICKLEFDYLVIATGMRPSYFGHPEFARYAPGLKNLTDAETIRAKILCAYELADMTDDENERERQMTFVLVGAGPTGVELAASMAQLAAVTLRGQFRRIDPARSSIILIEGGKRCFCPEKRWRVRWLSGGNEGDRGRHRTVWNPLSRLTRAAVPELDSFDGVLKCPLQNTLADGADHEAEQPALKVLAIADDDDVNVGSPIGVTRERVGVARRASP
jgi:hypothetical protein